LISDALPEFTPMPHAEKQLAFAEFLAVHGRSYASRDVMNSKFETFSSNLDHIHSHNAQN
jgi:hypothetical protein